MATPKKAYKGLAMEGPIARWYATITARDLDRFAKVAQAVATRVAPGGRVLEVAPGPGFLAIQLAQAARYTVTGLDIRVAFERANSSVMVSASSCDWCEPRKRCNGPCMD